MFGVKPACESCDLPELAPGNLLVWEIWKIVASGLGEHIGLDLIRLLERIGVRQPLTFLRKLAAIYRVARANAEKNPPGGQKIPEGQ